MKKVGSLFVLSFLFFLFFMGNVLTVQANNNLFDDELDNQTSISFDGEVEKISENIISIMKQKESISSQYVGIGNLSNFNHAGGKQEQTDISRNNGYFSVIGLDDRTSVTTTISFPYLAIIHLFHNTGGFFKLKNICWKCPLAKKVPVILLLVHTQKGQKSHQLD